LTDKAQTSNMTPPKAELHGPVQLAVILL